MSVETELFTVLDNHAGLTALITSRIYPLVAEEDATLPLVVYRRTGDTVHRAMSDDAAVRSLFRFDCWADSYSGAKAVAVQVHDALNRYKGGTIIGTLFESELPIREEVTEDWRVSAAYEVIWLV